MADCSWRDQADSWPGPSARSPMRGWAARACSTSGQLSPSTACSPAARSGGSVRYGRAATTSFSQWALAQAGRNRLDGVGLGGGVEDRDRCGRPGVGHGTSCADPRIRAVCEDGLVRALRARRAVVDGQLRAVTVLVQGERIVAIDHYDCALGPGTEVLDVPDDQVLLPGLVDSHVHVNEPGRTEWEGFATATAAAAAGGVTTIVDMPLNSIPPTVDRRRHSATKRAAAGGQLTVDVAFWGGAVPGNADQLAPLHAAGVVGFKCFLLPSGVDEFPPLDAAGLRRRRCGDRGVRRAAHRPRRGRRGDRRGAVSARPALRRLRRVPAARGRGQRDRGVARRRPGAPAAARTSCTCPAPRRCRSCARRRPKGCRSRSRPARTTWRCAPKTCPTARPSSSAARRSATRPTARRCGPGCSTARSTAWSLTIRRARSAAKRLDTGDFGAAWGGIASVQLGLPAVWTRPGRGASRSGRVVRWMAAGAGRAGRADRSGPDRGRAARRLLPVRPRRAVRGRPGPAAAAQPAQPVRRDTPCTGWWRRRGWLGRRSGNTSGVERWFDQRSDEPQGGI